MSSRPELKLDWATHAAAKYACEKWHYSRCMPIGKLVKVGVWEDNRFIGIVIYSTGASPQLHKRFGLSRFEVCELVRVALADHEVPVTRIIRISFRFLLNLCPGLRLCVSFADPEHDHHGGIYQAGNWTYVGRSAQGLYYRLGSGRVTHNRNLAGPKGFMGKSPEVVQRRYTERLRRGLKSGEIEKIVTAPKYKYLMPLDAEMRRQIEPLAKPYPKREKQAMAGTTGTAAGQRRPSRSKPREHHAP